MGVGERILDLLFPPKCAFCGKLLKDGEKGICAACFPELPRTFGRPLKCDFVPKVTAPLYYEGIVREALLRFKFGSAPAAGKTFGRMIGEEVKRYDSTSFDVITWAPLSPRRKRKRGYDQAKILAEAAAEELDLPLVPLLRKTRHTPPQSHIQSAETRRANVSGCYSVRDREQIAGKKILLIDDIMTTGATLSECSRMLMMAGADTVHGAALACRARDEKRTEKTAL